MARLRARRSENHASETQKTEAQRSFFNSVTEDAPTEDMSTRAIVLHDEPSGDDSLESSANLALEAISDSSRSRDRHDQEAARAIRNIADALAHANDQGILHRDIKPSNLLLDVNGRIWVTDFGLAKADDAPDLTRSREIVGTPPYMAPERFDGWCDPRSDIYSLGLVLYELLTMRPAFRARDRHQLVQMIMEVEPTHPRKIDRRIPRDLETIALRAIEKEPWRSIPHGRRHARRPRSISPGASDRGAPNEGHREDRQVDAKTSGGGEPDLHEHVLRGDPDRRRHLVWRPSRFRARSLGLGSRAIHDGLPARPPGRRRHE